jgi:hypothetical protein
VTRRSAIYNYAAELDAQCREDYELYLEERLHVMEEFTNGHLVNARGRALGITGRQLITGPGHHMKLCAYGTEELRGFFADYRVATYAEFERQWLAAHLRGEHE